MKRLLSQGWMISLLIFYNICSKCPPFAPHTITKTSTPFLLHCQWWPGRCRAKRAPNAAWVRQRCAPVTDTLATRRRPISCSQLNWGRDCLAATDPVEWKQVLLTREVARCHDVPGVQERCPVERWRTWLTRQHH